MLEYDIVVCELELQFRNYNLFWTNNVGKVINILTSPSMV